MLLFFGLLLLLFIALMLGMPVALSTVCASIVALISIRGIDNLPFEIIAQRALYGINNFTLLAIPAFLLVGRLMNASGVSDRIFNIARSIVGHYKGGLAHVNVVGSMIFAGMSGSAIADAGGLGIMEIKAMTDDGYPLDFSAATTAASATIGPVIPPSIPAVIYGALANESVGKIFIGSIIPGLMMGFGMMGLIVFIAHRKHYPTKGKATFRDFLLSLKKGCLPLFIPVFIIGGILTGVFTPTEASAIALFYCVIISFFIYRSITLKEFIGALKDTVMDTGAILFIVAGCSVYSWVLARYQVTNDFVVWVSAHVNSPVILLIYINIFLLLMGCFIDAIPIIFLITPILLPLIQQYGINTVHFGVVMILNLMIGLITPPVGTVLYTVQKVMKMDFGSLVKAVIPFYIPLFINLVIVTYIPQIVLFLPNFFFD